MADDLRRWAAAIALFAATAAAAAGPGLADPTRPPAPAAPEGAAAAAPAPPRLQSVLLPRAGKPSAIIDGERVELGGRFADARVTRISETEVVLSRTSGREVLRMTPAASKQPARASGEEGEAAPRQRRRAPGQKDTK